MRPETHQFDSLIRLGPFAVRADGSEAAEFAAALQLPGGSRAVPLTYPIRWLALPPVRTAMEEAVGTPHPLLASQSFDFRAGIAPDHDYSLQVTIRQECGAVPRAIVHGTVLDGGHGPVVEIETVLYPPTSVATSGRKALPSSLPEVAVGPIDMPYVARYAAASHDHNRLHSDGEFARSIGFDAPIIHGMITMGLFQKALREWHKDVRVARLFARFVRPVHVGSRLIIGGRLGPRAGRAPGSEQLVRLSVRVDDRLVCLGEAWICNAPSCDRPA